MAKHRKRDKIKRLEIEPEEEVRGDTAESDDIEIDLSGLKKIFSKTKKEKNEEAAEESESQEAAEEELEAIEFDVKRVGEFIVNHRNLIAMLVLLVIFSFAFYVRMVPARYTLLSAYDPFFWYRYAKYYLEGGFHFPASDVYSYYPPGRIEFESIAGWPAMEAFFFVFMRGLIPGFTLMQAAKILPAIFGAATVFPAYIIGKKASGRYGGLFSAFIIGTSPAILTRTVAGFSDTDACVMFFTLAVMAAYITMITSFKNDRPSMQTWALGILGGLIYASFALTWAAANYLLNILIIYPVFLFAFYLVFTPGAVSKRLLKSFDKVKFIIIFTILFLCVGVFASSMVRFGDIGESAMVIGDQFRSIGATITNFGSVTALKDDTTTTGSTGQSNVFISVAEMQAPGWGNYTSSLLSSIYFALFFFSFGSAFLIFRHVKTEKAESLGYITSLLFVLVGIIVYFTKLPVSPLLAKILGGVGAIFFMVTLMKRAGDLSKISEIFFEDEKHTILMLFILLWAGVLFVVSTLGIRFIMVLAPAVGIAAGVFLDKVIHSTQKLYPKAAPVVGGLLVILIISQFAPTALAISKTGPSMNTEWHDTLTWIKENTPQETTTISWWDPGHWVTAITQRYSGADGAHYTGGPRPIGYRLEDFGYMFTTTNETESLARMNHYVGNMKEMYIISSSDLMGKFVWLSYFSTGVKQSYLMAGLSGSQQQGNAFMRIYPIAQNIMVVLSDEDGVITPWLYQGDSRQKIREMAFYQNNQLQRIDYGEGVDAMVWVQPDYGMIIFMTGTVKDNILTGTYLFNGDGLEHLELAYQNPQIKLYRVHFE